MRLRILILLLLVLAPGCASRREQAEDLAAGAGFRRQAFEAGRFVLVGYLKNGTAGAGTLTVYLEGDGLAWLSRTQLSSDPTPRQPVALALAAADPGPAVLYLGRPCQYVTVTEQRHCDPAYWSSHRFAPEVVEAAGLALDQAKARTGARRLVLVGYSGGGVLAALLAATRPDVAALASVAAPLDHAAWTRHHRVDPLAGSLNPADQAARLTALPQIHFAGTEDEVVPPALVRAFLEREGPDAAGRLHLVPGADHQCCWTRRWPELRRLVPGG
jgi:pimeloyl-ACP methyl ester carboxylesterase